MTAVRLVHEAEYAFVGDLMVATYAAIEGFPLSEMYAGQLRDVARRVRDSDVLVAVVDGVIVGSITYVPGSGAGAAEFDDPDAAGIRMLGVAPSARGSGAGRALVEECIDRARQAGRKRIVLHSTKHMIDAQRLYRRLGFERRQELDWVPEPNVDLCGFVLRLDG